MKLDFGQSKIIDTSYKALCFANANGGDIYVYPGFAMMQSPAGDFALVDVRDLKITASQSSFVEEEGVPSDSEVIGQTWKKSNKDGSRDRRFSNNYQIPIAKYADLEFRSSTGLYEVYEFSNFSSGLNFASSFAEFQQAVTKLSQRKAAPPVHGAVEERPEEERAAPAVPSISADVKPPRFLFFDRIALATLLGLIAIGVLRLALPDG